MAAGDITGTTATVSERECAVFDGVDDYVDTTLNGSEIFPLSFSIWFKYRTIVGTDYIFDNSPGANGYKLRLEGSDDIVFQMQTTAGTKTIQWTNSITDKNKWYHAAVTWDGITASLYVDGDLKDDTPATGTMVDPADTLVIGADVLFGNNFHGCLSNLQIYNKTLSQEEVTKLAANNDITEGLTNRWRLDNDYKDSVGTADGTNGGTYLTNTTANKIKADVESLTLPAVSDGLTVEPVEGRDSEFKVTSIVREA